MVMMIFGSFALKVDEDGYSALRKARLKALREELDEMSDDEREDGEGDDVVEIKDEREMELEKEKATLKDEKKIKAVDGEANGNDVADDVEEEGEEEDADVEEDDEEEVGEEEDEGEEDKEEFCEIGEFCGSSENTPENGGDASEAELEEVDEEEIDLAEEQLWQMQLDAEQHEEQRWKRLKKVEEDALLVKKNSGKRKKKGRLPKIRKRKRKKWHVNWKKRKKFEGGPRLDCRRAKAKEAVMKRKEKATVDKTKMKNREEIKFKGGCWLVNLISSRHF